MKRLSIFSVFLLLILLCLPVQAEEPAHKLGFGCGYSYIDLKYFISSKFAMEARFNYLPGIYVPGLRVYLYKPGEKLNLYLGNELSYIFCTDEELTGSGFIELLYVGGEYFVGKKLSVSVDFGPAYTFLVDLDDVEVNVSGFDWVVNMGINYYFGKK